MNTNFSEVSIEKTCDGQFYVKGWRHWHGWTPCEDADPELQAEMMTTPIMESLLDACAGDFSRLHPNTAKAISIKATLLLEKREEQAKRRAEYRQRKAEQLHNCIVEEIRTLCGDSPCFTATQIQLLAAQNGLPVRTRQMYSSHLRRAHCDGVVAPVRESYKTVHVIYANGKSGTQDIRQKGGYKFN